MTDEKDCDPLFGPIISRYTAEDALRDGIFVKVGEAGPYPIYFTANLFPDGYEHDDRRLEGTVRRGFELLGQPDAEDTDYLRLRVIEKDRLWVTLTGEGYTFMKPEDY